MDQYASQYQYTQMLPETGGPNILLALTVIAAVLLLGLAAYLLKR